jgi:hypothetical protein
MLRIPGQPLDYGLAAHGVVFDPMTLMVGSMAATAAGTAISAGSTIAGGANAAALGVAQQREANSEADQLKENAAGELGAAQRRMLDTQQKTRLATSTLTANAAGGGINAGVGTPVALARSIASRGSYQSLTDLWQGQNQYTADLNKSAGVRYSGDIAEISGEMQNRAAQMRAMGTIAGGAGSMMSQYSNYMYPRGGGGGGYG